MADNEVVMWRLVIIDHHEVAESGGTFVCRASNTITEVKANEVDAKGRVEIQCRPDHRAMAQLIKL